MKRQLTEKLWREEKYRVMFHSQKYYNQIRQAMRDQLTHELIEQLINDALKQTATEGSMRNACQHMWGYFRKIATPEEKQKYEQLLHTCDIPTLICFLQQLAIQYNVTYLIESTILQRKDE
ncbi:YbgA family protein [Paenibacillus endoradicis]|uniref:YbgA family protein n=1 Tax=Paenibacillus endoradicis TaxID=2972487 RepID=UPI00215977B0|nr:YbgA family protein [Paenibacillus endoradicis]MCR8657392.1 YbgA family protein [Paenibacillus endoradicis]